MITLTEKQAFVDLLKSAYGRTTVTRKEIVETRKKAGLKPQNWAVNAKLRNGRGTYDVERGLVEKIKTAPLKSPKTQKETAAKNRAVKPVKNVKPVAKSGAIVQNKKAEKTEAVTVQ